MTSESPLDVGTFAARACQTRQSWANDGLAAWWHQQTYYPPLYTVWTTLPAMFGTWPELSTFVLWSDLLIVVGLVGFTGALVRLSAGVGPVLAGMLLLAGSPLFGAAMKTMHCEAGLLCAVGLTLWMLAGSDGLPSRRGAVVMGTVWAAGLLSKWTFSVYVFLPVLIAAGTWLRRGRGAREALVRLALATAVACILAGPWFVCDLDWARLRQTTLNDASLTRGTGFQGYLDQLCFYWRALESGVGREMLVLMVAGWLFALARGARGAALVLSSALGGLAVLSLFLHAEPRYLIPLLPSLALTAGLGLGGLPGPERRALVTVLILGAGLQLGTATWYHYFVPDLRFPPGRHAPYDDQMRMTWPHGTGREAFQRCLQMCRALDRPGELQRFGVHPLSTDPGLDTSLMGYLAVTSDDPPEIQRYLGYDWAHYCTFLEDVAANRLAMLILPEGVLQARVSDARECVSQAWTYVDQERGTSGCAEPRPPEDPFALDRLRERYGVLRSLDSNQGQVWLLLRKDIWARLGRTEPLAPIPGAHD